MNFKDVDFKVGETVSVKAIASRLQEPYPWYEGIVKCKIIEEYPNFYVATVLPHKSICPMAMGISSEYTVTLDKRDIVSGDLRVW